MNLGKFSQTRLDRMRTTMKGYVDRGDVPGIVTLINRRGETHVETYGTLAFDTLEPMQRNTLFRISSMTKPIAAVATLILAEECKLRLDDPVDRWLPELADRRVLRHPKGSLDDTVPANRPITVRDLLTLCWGFGMLLAPPDTYPIQQAMSNLQLRQGPPDPATPPAPDEWMRRLGTLPLLYQPGERWTYDTGFDVLGVLIARVAEQPLEDFLQQRIFAPLGMQETAFSVPADKLARFATSYQIDETSGALTPYDGASGQWSRPPAFPSAAGGLVSTVDDYLAFSQMLLNQGKLGNERILSRHSVELMQTAQVTAAQKTGAELFLSANRSWGLGVSIFTQRDDIAAAPGRFGWDGGLGTSWYADPAAELTGILMTQVMGFPTGIDLDFWTSIYQALDA